MAQMFNNAYTTNLASISRNGLMSASDKYKLDTVALGANRYMHPISSGYKHIPAGGAEGQILKWESDGTAKWSTDAAYGYATTTNGGLMTAADKAKLDGIATGANKYVLPTASNTTLGGVKTTSTVTSTSGLTACPIINGIPYYKDTVGGYTLPTASNTTLGGVKTTSTVTSTSGLTACPIIAGVPYYKITNLQVDSALSSTSTNPVQNKVIYSALSGKAASSSVPKVVSLTRAAYNALSTKDASTYYMITDDPGVDTTNIIVYTVGTNKQFTSFTQALRAAEKIKDRKVIINVYSGEYNVYNELGGDAFIKNIGSSSWRAGYQPILDGDVEIYGIGDVLLKLEIPDSIYSSYSNQCVRISPINNYTGSLLVDNITFKCKNCRYGIHDECDNNTPSSYTDHITKNCRFYMSNCHRAIGIGAPTGRYVIENCYGENYGTSVQGCVLIHNWPITTGAILTMSNCIFKSDYSADVILAVNGSSKAFEIQLYNNYFNNLYISTIDKSKYTTNIYRLIGIGNTINKTSISSDLTTKPYPILLT